MSSVLYLINQYPHNSHTFIRREILALERLGLRVERVSLRRSKDHLASEIDVHESSKTICILEAGLFQLARGVLREALANFSAMIAALRLGFKMYRRSENSFVKHAAYFVEACWLAQFVRERAPNHLHAHFGTNAAEVATLTHVLSGIPYSFTVHGYDEFDSPKTLSLDLKAEQATFVAGVSDYTKSQLMRWLHRKDWPKISVVRCGLEPDFITADFLAHVPGRFVSVGRICKEKAQLVLLAAMHQLKMQGVAAELVIVGDGDLRQQVEREIVDKGLSDCVRVTGWLSSAGVKEQLLSAQAFVHASFAEGLPVVLMEAMAVRKPAIATFIAGIPELVNTSNGWLVPASSADALAIAMKSCLETAPNVLEEMGTLGRDAVIERHHIDTEAAKLASLFTTQRR